MGGASDGRLTVARCRDSCGNEAREGCGSRGYANPVPKLAYLVQYSGLVRWLLSSGEILRTGRAVIFLPTLTHLTHSSSAKCIPAHGIEIPNTMPALRRELIHGDNIGLFYDHLDPTEIEMHSHRTHVQVMVLFKHAVCDLFWKVNGDEPKCECLRGRQICFVAPHVDHAIHWKAKAAVAKFFVTDRFLNRYDCAASDLQGVHVHDTALMAGQDSLARHLMSVFETLCIDQAQPHDSDFVVAAGRVLTGKLLRLHTDALRRTGRNGRLTPAQQRSLNGFFEGNLHRGIGVEELLPIVSLSKTHFIRLFTRTYGMPPVRYHLILRLRRAEELLLHSDYQILDAVHTFGFSDQSHFNRAFLKYLNYRPGAVLRLRPNPAKP